MGPLACRSRVRVRPRSVLSGAQRGSAKEANSLLHYILPLPLPPCCSNSPLSQFVATAEQHEMPAGIDGLVVAAQVALEIGLMGGRGAAWD